MKILILTSRFPYPLEKGDKLRLFHQIKYLSRSNDLILISLEKAPSVSDQKIIDQYCQTTYTFHQGFIRHVLNGSLAMAKGIPLHVGYFLDPGLIPKVKRIIEKEQPDHIFCQLIRMAPYLRNCEISKSIDYMDAFSLRVARRSKQSASWGWFWRLEAKRLQKFEKSIMHGFQYRFIISEPDRQYLQAFGINGLKLLTNGVDIEKFQKSGGKEQKFDIAFVGNMGYYPNVQAAKFLVKEIGAKLRVLYPDIRILIAGANPTGAVKALHNEWIHVSGFMEDIREAYQSAKVFVAPIFTGSGLQNKILEAMAMELPCVTTSIVNESIKAPSHLIRIADDVDNFVSQILFFLRNPKKATQIGSLGRGFVKEHFSWQHCCAPLDQLEAGKIVKP